MQRVRSFVRFSSKVRTLFYFYRKLRTLRPSRFDLEGSRSDLEGSRFDLELQAAMRSGAQQRVRTFGQNSGRVRGFRIALHILVKGCKGFAFFAFSGLGTKGSQFSTTNGTKQKR